METRTTRYTTQFQNIDLVMENEKKKSSTGEIQNHLRSGKKTQMTRRKSLITFFYANYEDNYGTIDLDGK